MIPIALSIAKEKLTIFEYGY